MAYRTACLLMFGAVLGLWGADPLAGRVLILVNDKTPPEAGTGRTGASVFVGEWYAQRRGIPRTNILRLKTTTEESIPFENYQAEIEKPVRSLLDAHQGAMRKRILYIVPVYGVPVRTGGLEKRSGSVDSRLAAMYAPEGPTRIENPYAGPTGSRPPRFEVWAGQREEAGLWKMFIVSRLDGPSALIAKGLVDKAVDAEPRLTTASGIAYFDYQGSRTPNQWQFAVDEEIRQASLLSEAAGFKTVLHVQTKALCGAMIHPAAIRYYDAKAGNLGLLAVESLGTLSFSLAPVSSGEVALSLNRAKVYNIGETLILTLSAADPKTFIRLSYPLNVGPSKRVTLEKVFPGASPLRVSVPLPAGSEAVEGPEELRLAFDGRSVRAYRSEILLAELADPAGTKIEVSGLSVGAQCMGLRLAGLKVKNAAGAIVWQDDFKTDSTAKYSWDLPPQEGRDALWVWGWYGPAMDSYRFVEGGVGAQLTSYTALRIRKPLDPDPAVAEQSQTRWGGNWVPRMLEEGVTATWGTVAEPYAPFYARGGNVFDHLWNGYNFGESFYIAENVLRWTMLAIGDPLYAPRVFQKGEK